MSLHEEKAKVLEEIPSTYTYVRRNQSMFQARWYAEDVDRVRFLSHDLELIWTETRVYRVSLLFQDGRLPETIYYQGWHAVPGPHWDYLEAVFKPWLLGVAKAAQQKDADRRAYHERKVAQAQEKALADWVQERARSCPDRSFLPPTAYDHIDDE